MAACSCDTPRPHLGTFNSAGGSQWRALTPLLYLSIKGTHGMTASVGISPFCPLELCLSVTPAVCAAGWGLGFVTGSIRGRNLRFSNGSFLPVEAWTRISTWGLPWCPTAMARTLPRVAPVGLKPPALGCVGEKGTAVRIPLRRKIPGGPDRLGGKEPQQFHSAPKNWRGSASAGGSSSTGGVWAQQRKLQWLLQAWKSLSLSLEKMFSLPCVLREAQWGKLKFPFCHLW